MDNSRLLTEAAICEAKWADTGLLDGIDDPKVRSITSVLLENHKDFLTKLALTLVMWLSSREFRFL